MTTTKTRAEAQRQRKRMKGVSTTRRRDCRAIARLLGRINS